MTKEELAFELNGNEYGDEISSSLIALAKSKGLVVVFGYSDDNTEFRGAFDEELPCYDGEDFYFDKEGANFTNKYGECFLSYHQDKDMHQLDKNHIRAIWSPEEPECSWMYETKIPHATFDIMEDGELYCRGIVFSIDDLK